MQITKISRNTPLSAKEKELLRECLIQWFKLEGRDLPWRNTSDPYKIWVSEVILQQTQVVQGWDYYTRFIDRFPDVKALANASEEELLLLWQGLGYYSRAHNMHHAAKSIMADFNGLFPSQEEDVKKLKGVGPYTLAAIMSFAYGKPTAVVDGNVYRVLSRVTASETPIDTTQGQKYYRTLAQELISKEAPRDYNQAIMDLGAMVCTPLNAKCTSCPLSEICRSKDTELVQLLPIKEKKLKVTPLFMDFFLLQDKEKILVEKRGKQSIWKSLYQFPLIQSTTRFANEDELISEITPFAQIVESISLPLHRLTHREISIKVHFCELLQDVPTTYTKGRVWLPLSQHPTLAFPIPLRKFLDQKYRLSTSK